MTELKKSDDDIPPLQIDGLLGPALQHWFDLVVGKYGGPGQFLNAVMTNEKDKDPFREKLFRDIPRSSCDYFDHANPPADKSLVKMHCGQLNFEFECTTRLWPYANVCKEILDDIIHGEFNRR